MIDITQTDQFRINFCLGKFRPAFAMRDRHRHARTGHALQQNRRRVLYFDQRETRLELFRQVAFKARPVGSAGDQIFQM